jgi:hypothetical protein
MTRNERIEKIKELALEHFNEDILPAFRDECSDDEKLFRGLGFLLSALHNWDSTMFLTFAYAAEDANFHDEHSEMNAIFEKYSELVI